MLVDLAHRVKTQKIFNGDLNAAKQNLMEQYPAFYDASKSHMNRR